MKCIKRIILIFMSVCIFGLTIYTDYQSVKAVDIPTAFWGTLEASRAFWTALNAGGGVRGGGVSLSSFEHSSWDDMHDLQVQVMIAYRAFCIWKEKASLRVNHPDWTEEEINQQAELEGRLDSARFEDSAINVDDTTKNLTIKDYGYWKEFCSALNNIAKNGLGSGEAGSNVRPKVYSDYFNVGNAMDNVGENTFLYNDKYYAYKGQYYNYGGDDYVKNDYDTGEVPTDRIRIPVIAYKVISGWGNALHIYLYEIDVNRLTGEVIVVLNKGGGGSNASNPNILTLLNNLVSKCNLAQYILNDTEEYGTTNYLNQKVEEASEKYFDNFNVENVQGGVSHEEYEEAIKNALDSTEAGKAIKEGANEGQGEIIKEGYIPVKRSSVKTGEDTATGKVGWDIPDARTLEGAIAVPDNQDDVIEGMGIISVPEDIVTPSDDDTVAEWAKDEPISIPDTKDDTITKPIDDVISEQYGDYYPTQISLSEFFPFCIPFDIYYCVQKFNVSQGEAPLIHIPIVYPKALQGVLGESYDVVIDFNNYIALRNIIRAFILIFFLVGLMQVTRNLIRG